MLRGGPFSSILRTGAQYASLRRASLAVFVIGVVVGLVFGLTVSLSHRATAILRGDHPIPQDAPNLSSRSHIRRQIKSDLHMALLTSGAPGYQDKHLPILFDTWLKGYEDITDVVSDTDNKTLPNGSSIKNFINAVNHGCGNTDKQFGLICKNNIIFRKWMFDADMKGKKWFFRMMDDTWAHMENLYELVSKLDHTKPIVIGDMWCHRDGYTYPSGGPGIIFSRGFWDTFNFTEWERTPAKFQSTVDDVSLGGYLHNHGIHITHHWGISQLGPYWLATGGEVDILTVMKNSRPYSLPFRPIAWHMSGRTEWIPRLHAELSSRNYSTGSDTLYFPPCRCWPKEYHRCISRKEHIPHCGMWHMGCFS